MLVISNGSEKNFVRNYNAKIIHRRKAVMWKDLKRFTKFSIKIFTLLIISLVIFTNCAKEKKGKVLASFDGGNVVQSEYIAQYLLSTKYKPKDLPTEKNLEEIVTQKAMQKIAVLEASSRHVQDDSLFRELFQKNTTRILFYKYMRQEVIDKVVSDSLIRKFYSEFSPQYHMHYIIRPVVKSSSKEFEKMQKDTIKYVYSLLNNGQKFGDLAKKYSQDITTKTKGGDIGWIIRESLGDAALRSVMDTLKEFHYSKPFRGYEGYYILFKGEKREVSVPPLKNIRERIWQSLYHTRRHNIRDLLEKKFNSVAPKYHFKINESVIKKIEDKASGDEVSGKKQNINFSRLTGEDLVQKVATFDQGYIRVSELFEDRKRAPENMTDFREMLISLSHRYIMSLEAKKMGIQNQEEVKNEILELRKGLERDFLYNQVVKQKARVKYDSLQQSLASAKKNGTQKAPEKINIFQIERDLKKQFEDRMKKKYHFTYVKKNFPEALKIALQMKKEQIKQNNNKTGVQTNG